MIVTIRESDLELIWSASVAQHCQISSFSYKPYFYIEYICSIEIKAFLILSLITYLFMRDHNVPSTKLHTDDYLLNLFVLEVNK